MEIKRFAGIVNTTSPERLKVGELSAAKDVDLDNSGKVLSRRGKTRVITTPLHSLYSNDFVTLAATTTSLVSIDGSNALAVLAPLTVRDPISYETVVDTVYWSNGTDVGRIVGSTPLSWGIVPPTSQPAALAVPGSLPPGRYRYAIVYMRANGQESGTGLSGQIDITTGGIAFSSIAVSTDTEITDKALYVTAANGEVLYRAAIMPNAQRLYVYASDGIDNSIPLATQFAINAPAGTLVREYNGVMYVVSGDTVYYSDAYGLELFRPDINFLRFPGRVVMFEPMTDGIYVGTPDIGGDDAESRGMTLYLKGSRPDKFEMQPLYDFGVIENTAVRSDAAFFDPPVIPGTDVPASAEVPLPITVWTSRHGICAGRDSGAVKNLTEIKHSFPTAQRGAAFVRQDRGYATYIVTLQGPGAETNVYAGTI